MNVLASIVLVFVLAEGYEGKQCTCKAVENMLGELEDTLKAIITTKMNDLDKLEARIAILEEPTTDECTASNYLLTGPYQVPDQALTSSSSYGTTTYTPKYSRLNTVQTATHGTEAWSAKSNDINQWIQLYAIYPLCIGPYSSGLVGRVVDRMERDDRLNRCCRFRWQSSEVYRKYRHYQCCYPPASDTCCGTLC